MNTQKTAFRGTAGLAAMVALVAGLGGFGAQVTAASSAESQGGSTVAYTCWHQKCEY